MKITLGWDSAGQIDPMWCRVMLDCLNSIALQIDPMFYGQLFL